MGSGLGHRFYAVARGPVPRECSSSHSLARETRSHARVACEGPRPTVGGGDCEGLEALNVYRNYKL